MHLLAASVSSEEPPGPARHLIANPALVTRSMFPDVSLVLFPLLYAFVYQVCALVNVNTSHCRAAMQVDMKQYSSVIMAELFGSTYNLDC